MLSDLQKRKLTSMFKAYDFDDDGFLVEADYQKVIDNLAEARGWKPDSPQYETLRDAYMGVWQGLRSHADANRDDRVSFDEMVAYNQGVMESRVRFEGEVLALGGLLFDLADMDGDGQIQPADMASFHRCLGEDIPSGDVFRRLDTNGDGRISKDEIVRHVSDFYYSSDPDAPGNWLFGPF